MHAVGRCACARARHAVTPPCFGALRTLAPLIISQILCALATTSSMVCSRGILRQRSGSASARRAAHAWRRLARCCAPRSGARRQQLCSRATLTGAGPAQAAALARRAAQRGAEGARQRGSATAQAPAALGSSALVLENRDTDRVRRAADISVTHGCYRLRSGLTDWLLSRHHQGQQRSAGCSAVLAGRTQDGALLVARRA